MMNEQEFIKICNEMTEEQKALLCATLIKDRHKGMDEAAAEYEATKAGKAFKKRIENAVNFSLQKGTNNYCISAMHLKYIAWKNYNNFINGSFDLWALGFAAGASYQKKKDRKGKKC